MQISLQHVCTVNTQCAVVIQRDYYYILTIAQ